MRAVRNTSDGIHVADVAEPEGEGVVVDVRAAGICGTDLRLVAQGYRGVTLGHEIAGVLTDGTAVVIEPALPCGACLPCERGDEQLCETYFQRFYGVGLDGGMADRVVIAEQCLVTLPTSIPLADASLVEPVGVCVHGMVRVGVENGMRVAVIGGGSIGLCAVVAAQAAGADVDLVARHDAQRAAGEALGAGSAITPHYDVVVDAAGSSSALAEGTGLCRPGGALLLLGSYFDTVELPGLLVTTREVSVVPASTYGHSAAGRDIDAAVAILARRLDLAPAVITHRFGLDEAPEAFRVAQDRAAGAIKVVLEP